MPNSCRTFCSFISITSSKTSIYSNLKFVTVKLNPSDSRTSAASHFKERTPMRTFQSFAVRALARAIALTISLKAQSGAVLSGQASFTDWNQQTPGFRHKIPLADLPQPDPEEAVDNSPHLIPKPDDA